MIEERRELHEESSLVPESTFDIENDTRVLTIIAPLGEHTTFEFYFCYILTVDSMYGDDSLPYRSDNTLVLWCWLTTLGNFVWDIARLAYDDIDSLWS